MCFVLYFLNLSASRGFKIVKVSETFRRVVSFTLRFKWWMKLNSVLLSFLNRVSNDYFLESFTELTTTCNSLAKASFLNNVFNSDFCKKITWPFFSRLHNSDEKLNKGDYIPGVKKPNGKSSPTKVRRNGRLCLSSMIFLPLYFLFTFVFFLLCSFICSVYVICWTTSAYRKGLCGQ